MTDAADQKGATPRKWRVPRGYAADQLIERELERAERRFGKVKSWELTPDGRVIVLPENDNGGSDSAGAGETDELAKMRARRDARQHQGAGVAHKAPR